jgi:hypothetical protein
LIARQGVPLSKLGGGHKKKSGTPKGAALV